MKKICLLTDQHICTNPRLWKEAKTFSNAGYQIVILSVYTTSFELQRDYKLLEGTRNISYVPVLNLIKGEAPPYIRFYYRLRRKLGIYAKRWFHLENSLLLGYAPDLLLKAAIREKADLYIAHMELSLYVGVQLMKNKFKVAFDIEDWYSRDYLIPERPIRLLEKLEQKAMEKGVYCSCPSEAMAQALKAAYPSGKVPFDLYNSFSKNETPWSNREPYKSDRPSIIWFSQTIGVGRGLETFLLALKNVHIPLHVKFIGDISSAYKEHLNQLFPFALGHSFEISPQIPHHELTKELSRHQIGLAIENDYPESRNLTITNKILQYTQAGLQVLATDTAGQRKLSEKLSNIHIVPLNDPDAWSSTLILILSVSPYHPDEIKKEFDQHYSWEVQEKKLLQLVQSVI